MQIVNFLHCILCFLCKSLLINFIYNDLYINHTILKSCEVLSIGSIKYDDN